MITITHFFRNSLFLRSLYKYLHSMSKNWTGFAIDYTCHFITDDNIIILILVNREIAKKSNFGNIQESRE